MRIGSWKSVSWERVLIALAAVLVGVPVAAFVVVAISGHMDAWREASAAAAASPKQWTVAPPKDLSLADLSGGDVATFDGYSASVQPPAFAAR